MQNILNIKDIPTSIMNRIREQFEQDPNVQQMRVRQGLLQRSGRYKEALGIARDMDSLFQSVVYEYMKDAEGKAEQVDIDKLNLPSDVKEKLLCLNVVMFMCADIIDSATMEVNDIIKKYGDDLNYEMFDDLRNASKIARDKLSFLTKSTGYTRDLAWGDACVNMFDMMKSKARSIRRKKNSPSWGKNNISD